ncbi:MAG: hypothetical protein LBQ79_10465 [Deltaproteobacteria bacterium]|jgi:hypothetical protein|nr:hypothetical protein [Deltaproteobacteria bacterium]
MTRPKKNCFPKLPAVFAIAALMLFGMADILRADRSQPAASAQTAFSPGSTDFTGVPVQYAENRKNHNRYDQDSRDNGRYGSDLSDRKRDKRRHDTGRKHNSRRQDAGRRQNSLRQDAGRRQDSRRQDAGRRQDSRRHDAGRMQDSRRQDVGRRQDSRRQDNERRYVNPSFSGPIPKECYNPDLYDSNCPSYFEAHENMRHNSRLR